ncbi:MAG: DsbC family protein [Pseudomonadales bacterium]|nr:DsbC family protein [Pseudomonadales bacterium]
MKLLMVCKVSVLAFAVGLYGCSGTEEAVADGVSTQEVAAQVAKAASAVNVSTTSFVPGEAAIRAKFRASLPQLNIVSITETVAPGIYSIILSSGDEMMTSADGSFIFSGDLLAVQERGILNISEQNRGKQRIKALSVLKDDDLVVFQAEGEEKGEVIAFTDTSCGYCQKFHAEIPALNKLGITVKYAAWPRYGLESPAGRVIADVWCAKDRANAMTMAKTRRSVGEKVAACDVTALINEQISLGRQVGVKGTPALFTLDGRQVGGYRSAADLAKEFGI